MRKLVLVCLAAVLAGCGGEPDPAPISQTPAIPTPLRLGDKELARVVGLSAAPQDPYDLEFARSNPAYFLFEAASQEDYDSGLEALEFKKPDEKERLKRCFAKGLDRYELTSYPEAVKEFECAAVKGDFAGQYNLACALVMTGDFKKARQLFEALLQTSPESPQLVGNLGFTHYAEGNTAKALELFDKLVKLRDDSQRAWHLRGMAYLASDRIDAAIQDFDRALDLFSQNHVIWTNKASALRLKDKILPSLQCLEKALELRPRDLRIALRLGYLALANGYAKESESGFKKALEIDEHNSQAYWGLGCVTFLKREPEAAIQYFQKGLTYNERSGELWWMLGKAQMDAGKIEAASQSLEKALNKYPDNVELLLSLGEAYGKLKRFDDSLSMFDKALNFKPNNGEAWRLRGLLCIEKGDVETAKGNIRKAIAFLPSTDAEKKQALQEVLQKLEAPAAAAQSGT